MTRKVVRAALLALIALVAAAALLNKFVSVETTNELKGATVSKELCSTSGISLVIEYDQNAKVFCVSEIGQSGWDVLNQVGATPQGTTQYPIGFVCKLFAYPSAQDCKDTPQPSEGTWNYFYATASEGAKWMFSPTGASIRKPKCGDYEAWVFEVPTSAQSARPPLTKPQPFICD